MKRSFTVLLALSAMALSGGIESPSFAANPAIEGASQAQLTQAEQWIKTRALPEAVRPDDNADKDQAPVRRLVKGVAKGTRAELGTSLDGMAKDMVLVFSCQDVDPYEKKMPKDRPCIVSKIQMVDGSQVYLHRFPDRSFAVEGGFADGTALVPGSNDEYIVKYPNGARGRVVFQSAGTILVYRPDNTVTTFTKGTGGNYSVRNTKFGYMGEARTDQTGVNYELGQW